MFCLLTTANVFLNCSCFLSLLLIATILWKVKQRYDLYRRRQVIFSIVIKVHCCAVQLIWNEGYFSHPAIALILYWGFMCIYMYKNVEITSCTSTCFQRMVVEMETNGEQTLFHVPNVPRTSCRFAQYQKGTSRFARF